MSRFGDPVRSRVSYGADGFGPASWGRVPASWRSSSRAPATRSRSADAASPRAIRTRRSSAKLSRSFVSTSPAASAALRRAAWLSCSVVRRVTSSVRRSRSRCSTRHCSSSTPISAEAARSLSCIEFRSARSPSRSSWRRWTAGMRCRRRNSRLKLIASLLAAVLAQSSGPSMHRGQRTCIVRLRAYKSHSCRRQKQGNRMCFQKQHHFPLLRG